MHADKARHHLRTLRAAVLGMLAAFLASCSEDDFADLQQYVTEVKSRKKEPVPPLPALKTVEPFLFRPDQVQDPFRRAQHEEEPEDLAKCSGNHPDPARPKEELESYELDALRMVGTVRLHGELWGLIQTRDNTIHRVRAGNYLGLRQGRVVAVKPDRIEVIEQVQQGTCVWEERQAALDLLEPGESK